MIRSTFSVILVKATYRWKDPETGRTRQESKKFCQTLNPFNKNAQGQQKTINEIRVELMKDRDAWLLDRASSQKAVNAR